ncbi:MAG TPA: hypothetical protein VM617_06615 [Thermoanaerobaculia bacterium]|nr:hypothetical protein [Thermoanaerobaculia bacterium]
MARSTIVLALALTLTGCVDVWGDWNDCSVTEPREASLDATGATRLEIVAGAGSLEVHGRDGAGRAEIRGTACASDAERLAGIELVAERRGDTLFVETVFAEDVDGQRRLALVIEVPASLAVTIEDGSGAIEVSGVAAVTIDDGSGAIDVRQIAGDVAIEDGSGAITLSGIGGDVRIDDGSGGIDVADVRGDVLIEEDGSGGIEIRGVGGSVTIGEDGSGGILVRDVRGDFTLHRDGSGSVDVQADGRVTLP